MNYTKFKNEKGEIIIFRTQQYSIGTYLIVNDDPALQTGLNKDEIKFHKDLHKTLKKQGLKIIETTVE